MARSCGERTKTLAVRLCQCVAVVVVETFLTVKPGRVVDALQTFTGDTNTNTQ